LNAALPASQTKRLFEPIVAWLNHRSITGSRFPSEARPGRWLLLLSMVGVIWMTAFSVYFLYLKFFQ